MADPIFKELAYAALAQTARNPTQDFLRATPRNSVLGYLADLAASSYAPQRTQQMQGIAQFFGAPAVSQTLDRLSYGEPLTTGAGGFGGTTRIRPEAIEAAMTLAPMFGIAAKATKGLPLGMSIKDVGAPQAEALRLAQQRAALPVEKGGLGLAADNTASQRAAAMGFDTSKPVFHGSAQPLDRFDNAMLGSNTGADDALIGHHFAGDRSDADLYATMAAEKFQKAQTGDGYGATGNIGEYLIRSKNPLIVDDFESPLLDKIEAFNYAKQNKNDSIIFPYGTSVDSAYTQVVFDPENIRLKNAAFDPFRKTAATAATMGVAAPDLLAQEQPNVSEAQQRAMIMRDLGAGPYTIYEQTGVWLGESK
jgi:hypothetical protein